MPTNTIRLHRVLRATPERIYKAFLDADAMAKWLPPNGFTGKVHHLEAKVRRHLQDGVHQFQHGSQPLLRWGVSRACAERAHSAHRQVRRPQPARRNADHDIAEEGVLRNRVEHRAGRDTRGHSGRGLLSRLAGIAHPACAAGRGRDSGVTVLKGKAMQVQPYLNFNGRCEEALQFYSKHLGAKVEMMMRFKDMPGPQQPGM